MGDSQHVKYAAMDVEREVLDTIVWTSATTIAGAVALHRAVDGVAFVPRFFGAFDATGGVKREAHRCSMRLLM
jgi:uncharacterized alkaline shock family protein YloU